MYVCMYVPVHAEMGGVAAGVTKNKSVSDVRPVCLFWGALRIQHKTQNEGRVEKSRQLFF